MGANIFLTKVLLHENFQIYGSLSFNFVHELVIAEANVDVFRLQFSQSQCYLWTIKPEVLVYT